MQPLQVVGEIGDIMIIAVGTSIREIARLRKHCGDGMWRKLKGIATTLLPNGHMRTAELHWCEAHGIGKKEIKIKDYLD